MSTDKKSNKTAIVRCFFLLISVILLLGACASTDRMMRITPFGRDEVKDPDRVNLWPLFYQSQDRTSVLWPLFDMDDQGFALRPLVAIEDESVSLLGPMAGWDSEKDIWWVIPAYKLEKNYGVFPLFGLGDKLSYIGPAYWLKDEYGQQVNGFGLFPLGYYGQKWGHFGTAWWSFDSQDNLDKGGLFPLLTLGTKIEQLGPVFWDNDNDEKTYFLTALPLFYYGKKGDTFTFISPLGGRGWSSDRNSKFTNILGLVFHMHWRGEETTTHVLWPVFYSKTGPNVNSTRLFPLYSRKIQGSRTTTSALLGTFKHKRDDDKRYLRLWPIFSDSDMGRNPNPVDYFTLYSNLRDNSGSHIQIGTGLLFGMTRDGTGEIADWNALLWALRYRKKHESEKFNVLWYLYRVNKEGETIHRDIFPFITWDTAPESSRFSFLSRFFSYERTETAKRLHLFFIPLWNSGPR